MTFSSCPMALPSVLLAAFSAIFFLPSGALAQGTCSSDGRPAPKALLERFINADCAACWADTGTPKTKVSEVALDWIAPSPRGDDAPLSAAASRDALDRLESLRQNPPTLSANLNHKVAGSPLKLRVAHGVALGGYMGASIELKARSGAALPREPLTAWLLLVEEVPAGTDGTPVARNLVRNALKSSWNINSSLSTSEQYTKPKQPPRRLYESRPMSIPQGANPERLRVIGWVEDAKGRVIAGAESQCDKPLTP